MMHQDLPYLRKQFQTVPTQESRQGILDKVETSPNEHNDKFILAAIELLNLKLSLSS